MNDWNGSRDWGLEAHQYNDLQRENMKTGLIFLSAAIFEIGGCFAFWGWLRLGKTSLWLLPGCCALLAFAYLLTLIDTSVAGRAYAAYGGIYITVAVLWMWLAEGTLPDLWDFVGAGLCLSGAAVILLAPHQH